MAVLDANILIRAVLGRRVRQLIDTYAGQGVRFFAPDVAFDDAEKYLPPLLKKRGKPHADFSASLEYLRNIIETVRGSQVYCGVAGRRWMTGLLIFTCGVFAVGLVAVILRHSCQE